MIKKFKLKESLPDFSYLEERKDKPFANDLDLLFSYKVVLDFAWKNELKDWIAEIDYSRVIDILDRRIELTTDTSRVINFQRKNKLSKTEFNLLVFILVVNFHYLSRTEGLMKVLDRLNYLKSAFLEKSEMDKIFAGESFLIKNNIMGKSKDRKDFYLLSNRIYKYFFDLKLSEEDKNWFKSKNLAPYFDIGDKIDKLVLKTKESYKNNMEFYEDLRRLFSFEKTYSTSFNSVYLELYNLYLKLMDRKLKNSKKKGFVPNYIQFIEKYNLSELEIKLMNFLIMPDLWEISSSYGDSKEVELKVLMKCFKEEKDKLINYFFYSSYPLIINKDSFLLSNEIIKLDSDTIGCSSKEISFDSSEVELNLDFFYLLFYVEQSVFLKKVDFFVKRKKEEKNKLKKDRIYTLDNLILDEVTLQYIKRIVHFLKYGDDFMEKYNLEEKTPYSKSKVVLFHGPSGTGKTFAVECIANELGKEILYAKYSEIVDSLVGQTSKNIDFFFNKAEEEDKILFLDEADALLIRRSSDFQAANKEFNRNVNFLLQKIEKTEVIVFLTTNYIENIDTAFFRRINYTIEFKKPGFQERKKLWELIIPAKLELDKDVDIELLAKKYKFTGGQIRQVVLNVVNNVCFMRKTKASMQDFIQACDTIYVEDSLKGEKIGFLGVAK